MRKIRTETRWEHLAYVLAEKRRRAMLAAVAQEGFWVIPNPPISRGEG